jgi:hypothetical protein
VPDVSFTPGSYPREIRGGSAATRPQAIAYNSDWTDYDRQVVARELDRVAPRTAYLWRTESNAYIRATDTQGHALLYIAAGYLWWHADYAPELPQGVERDGDGWILALSTRRESGPRRSPIEDEAAEICPKCRMYVLSASGVCFKCDE